MNWEVQKRKNFCFQCQKEFEHNKKYTSALFFNEKEEVLREDYCQTCWNEKENRNSFSSWQGTYIKIVTEVKIDKKKIIEDLFKQYLHSPDPQHKNYCYILALMLERKKIISEKNKKIKSKNTGKKLVIYEHNKTGEAFIIEDPEIALSEVGPLQREIVKILEEKGLTDKV